MWDTLRHHWAVAREALRREKEGAPPRAARDRDERAFLPAVLEVTESPASPLGHALLWVTIVFFVIALAWAWLGHIDIVATAPGRILPTARLKVIQALEAGVVRAVHVVDGSAVAAGDPLVELDPTESRADHDRLVHDHLSAQLEVARLRALAGRDPDAGFEPPAEAPAALVALHRAYLDSEWRAHLATLRILDARIVEKESEIAVLGAEIARLDRLLPSVATRVESRRDLSDQGIVPKLAFLELEEQLTDMQAQRRVQDQRLAQAMAALAVLRSERDHADRVFATDTLQRLTEAERRAEELRHERIKAEERHRRRTLRAPVDGTVQQLRLHTIGGVVEPAAELMAIVPADTRLEIEALVLNKDIGWVAEGQPVEIKVDSFPFTKYGVLHGRVETLSRDAVQDEDLGLVYPARISLGASAIEYDGESIPLSPGMTATAEIRTGTRRLIDYLLAPLLRYGDESLRER